VCDRLKKEKNCKSVEGTFEHASESKVKSDEAFVASLRVQILTKRGGGLVPVDSEGADRVYPNSIRPNPS
jgi:hypothetical protein